MLVSSLAKRTLYCGLGETIHERIVDGDDEDLSGIFGLLVGQVTRDVCGRAGRTFIWMS